MPLFDLRPPNDNIDYTVHQDCRILKERAAKIIRSKNLFLSGANKEIGKKDLISLYNLLQQDQEIAQNFSYDELDYREGQDGIFCASDPELFSIILDAAIEEVGKQPSTSPIRFASIEFPGDAASNLHYRFPQCTSKDESKHERGPSFDYLINARFDNCDVNSILNACDYGDYKDKMPVLVGHEKTKDGVKKKIEDKQVNIANSFFYSFETVISTANTGFDLSTNPQTRISPAIPPIATGIDAEARKKDQKRYDEEVNKQSSERSGSIFRDHTEPTIYHVEGNRMMDNPKNIDVTSTEIKSDGTVTQKTKTYTESFANDLSSIVNSDAYKRAMNRSKPSTSPTTFRAELVAIDPADRTRS